MCLFFRSQTKPNKREIAIMIDEVYYQEEFESLSKFVEVCETVWVAAVEAGQKSNTSEFTTCLLKFNRETLHVLFRNSQHISKTSHSFIESNSSIFSDNRIVVAGCFQSAQPDIKLKYIKLDQTSLSESEDVAKFLKQKKKTNFFVVLFTNQEKKMSHRKFFELLSSERSKVEIIDESNIDAQNLPFTGAEFQSVLVIVEDLISPEAINLAVTRAQFEVDIIATDSLKTSIFWNDYIQRLIRVQSNYKKFMKGVTSIEPSWLAPESRSDADYNWLQKQIERDWEQTTIHNLLKYHSSETILSIAVATDQKLLFHRGAINDIGKFFISILSRISRTKFLLRFSKENL